MAKGHWRAAHIPKFSKKRRFTDAQRAAYWKKKYLDCKHLLKYDQP